MDFDKIILENATWVLGLLGLQYVPTIDFRLGISTLKVYERFPGEAPEDALMVVKVHHVGCLKSPTLLIGSEASSLHTIVASEK